MEALERQAQTKSEKRADYQKAYNAKTATKNTERQKAALGTGIALDWLRTRRVKYQTAKKRADLQLSSLSNRSSKRTTARPKGKPKVAV